MRGPLKIFWDKVSHFLDKYIDTILHCILIITVCALGRMIAIDMVASEIAEPVTTHQIVYVYVISPCKEIHVEDAVEEVPEVVVSSVTLSDSDHQLLRQIIAAEARGEGYEGMMAVAQVIRDRMEHPNTTLYGGPTLRGVVLKQGQFAKPWSGDLSKYPDIHKAIEAVFTNGERVFEEPTLFFYYPKMSTARGAAPIRRYNYVGQVGVHHFHGDKKIND